MQLKTKRLVLRNLRLGDEKAIRKNINNLNVSRYLLVVPYPYTRKNASEFVRHCISEANKKPRTNYEFGIELQKTPGIIGMISLTKIDRFRGIGMIGYWLGEDYWRKGIMSDALIRMIDYTFNTLKLRRIDITAASVNEASNALIRKIGFVYEGTRRQRNRVKSTGEIYDENLYGLLKKDWKR